MFWNLLKYLHTNMGGMHMQFLKKRVMLNTVLLQNLQKHKIVEKLTRNFEVVPTT